jgi:hypothetical protein
LLEGRYDWKVFWTDFTPGELASEKFAGYVASWKKLVDARALSGTGPAQAREPDLSKVPVAKLIGMLTVPQIAGIVTALVSLIATVAAAAYKVGGGEWPWS